MSVVPHITLSPAHICITIPSPRSFPSPRTGYPSFRPTSAILPLITRTLFSPSPSHHPYPPTTANIPHDMGSSLLASPMHHDSPIRRRSIFSPRRSHLLPAVHAALSTLTDADDDDDDVDEASGLARTMGWVAVVVLITVILRMGHAGGMDRRGAMEGGVVDMRKMGRDMGRKGWQAAGEDPGGVGTTRARAGTGRGGVEGIWDSERRVWG